MLTDFVIPVSVRSVEASLEGWPYLRVYCWECGSEINVTGYARLARCGGCRASERQQAREDAHRDRFPEESDDEG